jgi:hypothetical protein
MYFSGRGQYLRGRLVCLGGDTAGGRPDGGGCDRGEDVGAVACGQWPFRLSSWRHREAHSKARRSRRSIARAAFSADNIEGELAVAAPLHLMPSGEECAHRASDVVVDGSKYRATRSIAKSGSTSRAEFCSARRAHGRDRASDYAWYNENSEGKTQPVATKKTNAFGGSYQGAPSDGSAGWSIALTV